MSLFDSASLVVTPNGYKEDKLYSIKPTDGSGDLVVTRATTATRVNSAGLIEQVPYNLLTYSEQFDNAAWSKISVGSASVPVVTANSTTAPNGTLTADKIVFNAPASGDISIIKQNISLTGTANGSIYIKAFLNSDIGKIIGFRFNADTYALITLTDSWQRFSVSQVALESFDIQLRPSVGTSSGSVSVYVWGAQLVSGTSAKEYFPTTDRLNVPRIDYTNGSCPSILVEPQRTNLITYSEQFDNVIWLKQNATITANSIISPDGTTNADSLIAANGTANFKGIYALQTTAAPKSFSFFAKKGNKDWAILLGYNGDNNCWFNVSNGTIGTVGSNFINAKIENYGNGWYRCSATLNSSVAILNNLGIYVSDADNSTSCTGNGTTPSLYIWGAQVESGSYPTSYIPTVASSVTRNADVISKTGISSLIGQTEGTMFLDVKAQLNTADEQDFSISDGTTNNRVIIRITSTGVIRGIGVFAGNVEFNIGGTSYTSGNRYKIALAYKNNDVVLYINGTSAGTTSTTTISGTLSRLGFDVFTNGAQTIVSPVNAGVLFKTRLDNATLAQLTTI
jgi:hypothetical protein